MKAAQTTGKQLFQRLVGKIIPADELTGCPGADDETIFDKIISYLDDIEFIIEDISGNVESSFLYNYDNELNISLLIENLKSSRYFQKVVFALARCYYTDKRVTSSLDLEDSPPFPKGYAVKAGDWNLLSEVKERKKIWRDA